MSFLSARMGDKCPGCLHLSSKYVPVMFKNQVDGSGAPAKSWISTGQRKLTEIKRALTCYCICHTQMYRSGLSEHKICILVPPETAVICLVHTADYKRPDCTVFFKRNKSVEGYQSFCFFNYILYVLQFPIACWMYTSPINEFAA